MANMSFSPRVINPKKIADVVIFSADEKVRKAGTTLKKTMPWIQCISMSDPFSVMAFQTEKACAFIFDDTSMTFINAEKIHANNKDSVVILLSSNDLIHRSTPAVALEKFPYTGEADLIFAFDQTKYPPNQIITSVVRSAEDLLNIERFSQERRFIFLIVDDEPRWFSEFLPVLYDIIGQRADIKVTRTYEETLKFLFGVERESEIDKSLYMQKGHGDDVVCLITDVFFPRGDQQRSQSGVELIKLVNFYYPRIPTIIASKAREAEDLKDIAYILPKGDPGSIEQFRRYIIDHSGIGDFLVLDEHGGELFRAKHITDLYMIIKRAKKETGQARRLRAILENYGRRDSFSTWLYMHGFRALGNRLRPIHITGQEMISVLETNLKKEIELMKKIPLLLEDEEILNLHDLLNALKKADPASIQPLSDTDTFSAWLDCKSFPELAEELRPIHGSGQKLSRMLTAAIEKWIAIYEKRRGFSTS